MQDFFNVILHSTAAIISSVALLFTGAPSPAAQQQPQPASVVVAVAPTAQDSSSMVSPPANNTAVTPIFVPEPTAVAASLNTAAGISQNYVDGQIQILRNSLSSEIFKYSSAQFPNAPGISQSTANLAVSQRIDRLSGTTLSNITVSGVSGLILSRKQAAQRGLEQLSFHRRKFF